MNINYDLLLIDIPDSKKQPLGFLEIINKQYHENINSSVYAHFINCDELLVKELFLNSLTEIIEEKTNKSFSFSSAFAECEVVTEKGRIDIVIRDREGDQVIIIENKIFHWLHNDLADYWNHFKCKNDKKIGVLLTPNRHHIPENVSQHFINITHGEWIARIRESGLPVGLSLKYTLYVSDFINTIEQFTNNHLMDEQAKFYFQHAPKILKIQETSTAAHQFINNQFQLLAGLLGWESRGNSLEWRNFWDGKNEFDTYLTIVTGDLLRGEMKVSIILELYRQDKVCYKEAEDLLANHPQFIKMTRGESKGKYLHFGVREYRITKSELENLADYLYNKIKEDFSDATLKVIQHFYPEDDILDWIHNFAEAGVNSN